MRAAPLGPLLDALPKAELHLHLEGSIAPATVVELAARHGVRLTAAEAAQRYQYRDFRGFLEAFKWVTSFLRAPDDYRLITERLAVQLLSQNIVYAEVTVAAGVMLFRKQDAEANFAAIADAADNARKRGLRMQWIPDATRQFGPGAAMDVARLAADLESAGIVAFGMGGDELSIPAGEFRAVYDFIRGEGLHAVAHAGEIGGPEEIRDAIELLGAERIGHGIAAANDSLLMELLEEKRIPLEICPTSNLRTGALARQLGQEVARIEDHPLCQYLRRGLRLALSTDDPAMFQTTLSQEYALAARLGLVSQELARLARMSFEAAFLAPVERDSYLAAFQDKAAALGLV